MNITFFFFIKYYTINFALHNATAYKEHCIHNLSKYVFKNTYILVLYNFI